MAGSEAPALQAADHLFRMNDDVLDAEHFADVGGQEDRGGGGELLVAGLPDQPERQPGQHGQVERQRAAGGRSGARRLGRGAERLAQPSHFLANPAICGPVFARKSW